MKRLEDASALDLLPTLMLLGLLAFLGFVGNGVALYVYYTRFTPSSTRTYILAMSVFDMLFNAISMPGEILDLRFSLTYNTPWLCAMERFLTMFITLVAGFILVAVALDRRRKICCPFRPQVTARYVTLSVCGCVAVGLVLSVPFGVLNGRHTVQTDVPGVVGSACSVDDRFQGTRFPLVYNLVLVVVFLACTATMATSYVQIARKIVKHRRQSLLASPGVVKGLAQALDNLDSHSGRVTSDMGRLGSHTDQNRLDSHSGGATDDQDRLDSQSWGVTDDRDNKAKNDHHRREGNQSAEGRAPVGEDSVFEEDCSHEENPNAEECSPGTKNPPAHRHCGDSKSSEAKCTCQSSSVVPTAEAGSLAGENNDNVFTGKPEERNPAAFLKNTTQNPAAKAKGRNNFRSRSVKEKEEELEMAVRILVHAVSEDMLQSHELFAQRVSRSANTRSASVGDESTHVSHVSEFTPQYSAEDHCATAKRRADDELFHVSKISDFITEKPEERAKAPTDVESSVKNGGVIDVPASSEIKAGRSLPSDLSAKTRGKVDKAAKFSASVDSQVTTSSDKVQTTPKASTVSESGLDRFPSILRSTLRKARSRKREDRDMTAQKGVTSSLLRRHARKKIPSRTTWMMFVLTAIFVISYLPYLIIKLVRAVHSDLEVMDRSTLLSVRLSVCPFISVDTALPPLILSVSVFLPCAQREELYCRLVK